MTPEEQETIQKSKDPSVISTPSGTTHTTEEPIVSVCDLDMFVQVQVSKESPAVLSLGKMCEENGFWHEWHPGHPSCLIKNGRNIGCKTDNHVPLVVPGVQTPGGQFGRFAEQSPLTDYEPNDPVDVSSTEGTPMLLPSRRASIGSTKKSSEDIATTLASSEVDERQSMGMLASPLFTRKRAASAAPSRINHSKRENYVSNSSHIPCSAGKPLAMYSHKRK